MRVFAISDLHLSSVSPKPMDIFGQCWDDHWNRIKQNWIASVCNEDVVLIPGDISWAMRLEDARVDFDQIDELPGQKIILRGNHDYWWDSYSKVKTVLPNGIKAIQNNHIDIGGVAIAGTRGWTILNEKSEADDIKIFKREAGRLRLSLSSAKGKEIIAMLHYPPFNDRGDSSEFTDILEEYGVSKVIYGHLHDLSCKNAFEGFRNGIEYKLVSCDHLQFIPKLIAKF